MGRCSNKRAEINTDKIIMMFNSGDSISLIGSKLNLFRRNVKRVLLNNGVIEKRIKPTKKDKYNEQYLDFYKQFEQVKLKEIIKRINPSWRYSVEEHKAFILKFYNDDKFNYFYNKWIETSDRYFKPNINHIIPKSKGGGNGLDNLQCLSCLENRIKSDLLPDVWDKVKNRLSEYLS
jgi:hypothetical protein